MTSDWVAVIVGASCGMSAAISNNVSFVNGAVVAADGGWTAY
ncbi:hypothetical protein [Methanoculleus methanifontis]|nr:hypothetical protein [Methanoculleus sp. FWC-SCC3]